MNSPTKTLIAFLSLLMPAATQELAILPAPPSGLVQHLSLSEAQVEGLRQVQKQKTEAESALYKQMSEKQQQLNALLEAGSNDAGTVTSTSCSSNGASACS